MSNPYNSQTISGYNSSPPPDDGTESTANEITWAKHKTKLADPIKTLAEAINTELVAAFDLLLGATILVKSTNYTILAADRGAFFSVSGTTTITLIDIATAGDGFPIGIINTGVGVVTIDAATSETINGSTTVTLQAGAFAILTTDGTNNWVAAIGLGIGQDGSGSGLDADTVDGSEASALLARGNHTGTQTLATISDSGAMAAEDNVDEANLLWSGFAGVSQVMSQFTDVTNDYIQYAITTSYVTLTQQSIVLLYCPANVATLNYAFFGSNDSAVGTTDLRVKATNLGTGALAISSGPTNYVKSSTGALTIDASEKANTVVFTIDTRSAGAAGNSRIKALALWFS